METDKSNGGYPPSVDHSNPTHHYSPMPSPPPLSQQSPAVSGYTPSSAHNSQYGAPYGAPPSAPATNSAYGTPQQNYGVPAQAPAYGGAYAPGPQQQQQHQSMYGAPPAAAGWGNGQQPQHGVQQQQPPQAMGPPAAATTLPSGKRSKICGLPVAIFWIILIAAIIICLGALGAGLGVGLSRLNNRNNNASTSSDSDPANPFTTSPTTTTRSPTTRTTAASRATAQPTSTTKTGLPLPTQIVTDSAISCPADNNVYYAVSSITTFRVLCGVTLSGLYLHSNHSSDMGACMKMCSVDDSCTGVTYKFSSDATQNCDMFWSIDETEVTTTSDVAFGAYNWIWDLLDSKVKRDGLVLDA